MSATRGKTSYLTQVRLQRFLARYLPSVWLITFTFRENITDKSEAMRRFKPIADYLKRQKADWCGVWQQQRRGAWHLHMLVNRWQDVNVLREFAVARGWGQFINAEKVGDGGYRFMDSKRVVSYLTRYLSRDMCEHVPMRVRLAAGTKPTAVGTVKFSWVHGVARAWRYGCELFSACYGYSPRSKEDRQRAFGWGLRELGFLDFLPITADGPNPYDRNRDGPSP